MDSHKFKFKDFKDWLINNLYNFFTDIQYYLTSAWPLSCSVLSLYVPVIKKPLGML